MYNVSNHNIHVFSWRIPKDDVIHFSYGVKVMITSQEDEISVHQTLWRWLQVSCLSPNVMKIIKGLLFMKIIIVNTNIWSHIEFHQNYIAIRNLCISSYGSSCLLMLRALIHKVRFLVESSTYFQSPPLDTLPRYHISWHLHDAIMLQWVSVMHS